MNWTQPICAECFKTANPDREPTRMLESDQEKCCVCGHDTNEGIYIRADPLLVSFPKEET